MAPPGDDATPLLVDYGAAQHGGDEGQTTGKPPSLCRRTPVRVFGLAAALALALLWWTGVLDDWFGAETLPLEQADYYVANNYDAVPDMEYAQEADQCLAARLGEPAALSTAELGGLVSPDFELFVQAEFLNPMDLADLFLVDDEGNEVPLAEALGQWRGEDALHKLAGIAGVDVAATAAGLPMVYGDEDDEFDGEFNEFEVDIDEDDELDAYEELDETFAAELSAMEDDEEDDDEDDDEVALSLLHADDYNHVRQLRGYSNRQWKWMCYDFIPRRRKPWSKYYWLRSQCIRLKSRDRAGALAASDFDDGEADTEADDGDGEENALVAPELLDICQDCRCRDGTGYKCTCCRAAEARDACTGERMDKCKADNCKYCKNKGPDCSKATRPGEKDYCKKICDPIKEVCEEREKQKPRCSALRWCKKLRYRCDKFGKNCYRARQCEKSARHWCKSRKYWTLMCELKHKASAAKTRKCVKSFKRFPPRLRTCWMNSGWGYRGTLPTPKCSTCRRKLEKAIRSCYRKHSGGKWKPGDGRLPLPPIESMPDPVGLAFCVRQVQRAAKYCKRTTYWGILKPPYKAQGEEQLALADEAFDADDFDDFDGDFDIDFDDVLDDTDDLDDLDDFADFDEEGDAVEPRELCGMVDPEAQPRTVSAVARVRNPATGESMEWGVTLHSFEVVGEDGTCTAQCAVLQM